MLAQTDSSFDGPITVEVTRYGSEVLVVTLGGELDRAVAAGTRAALFEALSEPCPMAVVDLTQLEFIDSSGIALLYSLGEMRPTGTSTRLVGSRHVGVSRILALTELAAVIPIIEA